jgi:hypothetical protein
MLWIHIYEFMFCLWIHIYEFILYEFIVKFHIWIHMIWIHYIVFIYEFITPWIHITIFIYEFMIHEFIISYIWIQCMNSYMTFPRNFAIDKVLGTLPKFLGTWVIKIWIHIIISMLNIIV